MCQPTESISFLKSQVEVALKDRDDETDASSMRIVDPSGKVLADDDTLQSLANEAELHVVFAIADGEWEPVDLVDLDSSDS
jgi:hypothetical protein